MEWTPTSPTHALVAHIDHCIHPDFSDTAALSCNLVNVGNLGDFGVSQSTEVTRSSLNALSPAWPYLEPVPWMDLDSFQTETFLQPQLIDTLRTPETFLDVSDHLPYQVPADVAMSAHPTEILCKDEGPLPQTQFRHVLPIHITRSGFRGVHPPDVWRSHKATIKQLYLDEGKSLKDVMRIMQQQHSFRASPRMYKTRFRQWGFEKNNTEKDMSRMLLVKFQRDVNGKPSRFSRHGKEIDIQNYLRRKGMTEYDLVDFETTAKLPTTVRCHTPPTPESTAYLRSPDIIRYQELLFHHVRNVLLDWRQERRPPSTSVRQLKYAVIRWPKVSGHPILMLENASDYYSQNGHTETGLLMRKLAFRRLYALVKQNSHDITLALLFREYDISDPELILSLWKFVAAVSVQRSLHDPLTQLYGFLYNLLHKEGISVLHAVLDSNCLQLAEEAEKVLGKDGKTVETVWWPLRYKFGAQTTRRFQVLLETLQNTGLRSAASSGPVTKAEVRLMLLKCRLLRALDPSSDEAAIALEQLQCAITRCQDLTHKRKISLLHACAYDLHRTHLRRGWNDPAIFNPRIELAAYYLEEYIKYSLEIFGDEVDDVIDHLHYLELMYDGMGWQEKATDTRIRRKRCEAAASAVLESEDAR